jgi:predicted polyphosphate/ATP-dependent NAD kinase
VTSVGIIANPASGSDIRRLVAQGSTFDNNEKVKIVRRVLAGLDATDVESISYMPDTHAIVRRAAETIRLRATLSPISMTIRGLAHDSLEAARRLAEADARCIITLGGDGTNRVVAKGAPRLPLVAISTGTNNVFPRMFEGTLAGLAAGLVATGVVTQAEAVRTAPQLDVLIDGELRDHALIDVVTSRRPMTGARALWEPDELSEVVLSRITASEIGVCSLGGVVFPDAIGTAQGAHLTLDRHGQRASAPLAPGLIRSVGVTGARLVALGECVAVRHPTGTIALDGEREIEIIQAGQRIDVMLNPNGPRVVDITAALNTAAARGGVAAPQH